MAGDLDAHLQGLVSPDSFPFSLSLFFFAAVVLGGLASVWGSLAGAVILAVIEAETSSSSGWEPVILGGAVVLLLLFLPRGLADFPYRAQQALRRWRGRKPRAAVPPSRAEVS